MKDQPQIIRPRITNSESIIPDEKRGDKTLREIVEEIRGLLKHYRSNCSVTTEFAGDAPYTIRLNYEIFLK